MKYAAVVALALALVGGHYSAHAVGEAFRQLRTRRAVKGPARLKASRSLSRFPKTSRRCWSIAAACAITPADRRRSAC